MLLELFSNELNMEFYYLTSLVKNNRVDRRHLQAQIIGICQHSSQKGCLCCVFSSQPSSYDQRSGYSTVLFLSKEITRGTLPGEKKHYSNSNTCTCKFMLAFRKPFSCGNLSHTEVNNGKLESKNVFGSKILLPANNLLGSLYVFVDLNQRSLREEVKCQMIEEEQICPSFASKRGKNWIPVIINQGA